MKSITEQGPTPETADLQKLVLVRGEARLSRISWLWHLLNFSPFFLLVWFVSSFSVKAPFLDDWRFAYLFHAVRLKQATFDDFFALIYEHRLFFPKLVWTPLAFATHWNLKVQMIANLVPALIVFAVFYQLALRQARQVGTTLSHLANFSTSLVAFSLVQYETWLWGTVGALLLVQASVALAIGVCFLEKFHPWARFASAAFFCFIASFSMAHGLFSWLALFPCIALLPTGKRTARKLYIWSLLFAASLALYTYHYEFFVVPEASTPLDFLHHPLRSIEFFIVLLGTPFRQGDAGLFVPITCLTGVIILLAFVSFLVMLRGQAPKDIIAPWISVALFGLLFTAMVTAGRSPRGLMAANQSRYITGTIFVLIAVIQLGRLVCARKGRQIYVFSMGAVWSLMILGSVSSLSEASHLKEERSHAKLFLELLRYMDPAVDSSAENPISPLQASRPAAELLNDLGFIHLASNITLVDRPCPDCGLFETAAGSGDLLHLRQRKDEVTVSGWASLPGARGLPKVVLISYGERKTFITGAVVGWVNRPDIAALQRDPRYLHSGWSASFPAKFLPLGGGVLKAWVYDAAQKSFIRLPEWGGKKQFNVETQ